MNGLVEDEGPGRAAEAALPTRFGRFRIVVFDGPLPLVALVHGVITGGAPVLVRLHSECLTGDVLGSLRCDCGEQLEASLEALAAAPCGVLLYLRQEGRGIGLANKVRAYALQDSGLDTVDANTALGLPVDGREYGEAAAALRRLGVVHVRLLTNNPAKQHALERSGLTVVERVPLEVLPNPVNRKYLGAKARRMGHLLSLLDLQAAEHEGSLDAHPWAAAQLGRPAVTIHYAQTLDGRIATRTGNSQWVSGQSDLRLAHRLRASHAAVMVGLGTVLADDPRLTVRLAPGRSPRRVVLDSTLRLPLAANVLADGAAPTLVATTARAPAERVVAVRALGAEVLVLPEDAQGRVDIVEALRALAERGIGSVLIEGGRGVITSALAARVADRLIVCIAPKVIGAGIEAVGDLHIMRLSEALTFAQARFHALGEDVIFDGLLAAPRAQAA